MTFNSCFVCVNFSQWSSERIWSAAKPCTRWHNRTSSWYGVEVVFMMFAIDSLWLYSRFTVDCCKILSCLSWWWWWFNHCCLMRLSLSECKWQLTTIISYVLVCMPVSYLMSSTAGHYVLVLSFRSSFFFSPPNLQSHVSTRSMVIQTPVL